MLLKRIKNFVCFLPESFEWLILKSGLIKDKELPELLNDPAVFIESKKYIWIIKA